MENVSFDVEKGSRHALIGPNGAGKTTLFNVISGIHDPEKGTVYFKGKDLRGVPSRKRIHRGLSRSFQNIRLMPHLSVLENVMLGQHSRIDFVDMFKPLDFLSKSSGKGEAIETLKSFLPKVSPNDWKLSIAGQRVQIIKQTSKGGVLKMGTEVVTSSDGSLAALLGASPGASTAVTIMIEVLNRCWEGKMKSIKWKNKMLELFPSIGTDINTNEEALLAIRKRNDFLLKLI